MELKWCGGPNEGWSITVKLKGKTVIDKAQAGLKERARSTELAVRGQGNQRTGRSEEKTV